MAGKLHISQPHLFYPTMSSIKFSSVILILFIVIFAVVLISVVIAPLLEYWNLSHVNEAANTFLLRRQATSDNDHLRSTREEALIGTHQEYTTGEQNIRDLSTYRNFNVRAGSFSEDHAHNISTASLTTIPVPPPVYMKPLSLGSQGLPSYEMSFSKEHIPPGYTR